MPLADETLPAPHELAALRELAAQLARDAGLVALAGRKQATLARSGVGGTTKSTPTDVVTEFDKAAEASIVATLRQLRPDDAIVGEEGTADAGTSGYSWYIDPIDGTTSFVYDQPTWACSVGVGYGDTMVAGAVFLPVLDELYTAALGAPATCNGRQISPTACDDPALALVGTGFNYEPEARRIHTERLVRMIEHIRDIRRSGSAAVDLCFVASGRIDVYFEGGLHIWDWAAGELIARQAGAITSDYSGERPPRDDQMLACAPGLHRPFVDLLDRT